jgi:hypothetical protein
MTNLCPNCKLPDSSGWHAHPSLLPTEQANVCRGAQQEATLALLRNIGDSALCSGCQAAIYWVRHKNGRKTPYDPSGLNHFISCPKAEQFSTRKKVS